MHGATLPTDDRSFLYGDGLFETLLVKGRRVLWPQLHVDRLMQGCDRLGITFPRQQAEATLQSHFDQDAMVLRLSLSRGSGPRGYAPPKPCRPALRLSQHPAPRTDAKAGLKLVFSSVHLAPQPLLAGIKHCNRLEQVLAAHEARSLGADEAILTTPDGAPQCAISANVFAVCGETLTTPPVESAGVAGTRRRLVLERLASLAGLRVRVAPMTKQTCLQSDALILTNAVHGIRSATSLEDIEFSSNNEAVLALQAAYAGEVQRCLES